MSDELVTIGQFADYIQANLAKQTLADAGIEAIIGGENASNVFAGISAIEGPTLQVLKSRAAEALEILEPHQKQEQ